MPHPDTPVRICWADPDHDLPRLVDIERKTASDPWTVKDYRRHLSRHNCIGLVAEAGGQVLGLAVYELHTTHLKVVKLAVDPDFQGQGIGSRLVATLAGKLSYTAYPQRDQLVITVDERHLSAQQFLRSVGFRASEVLRDHITVMDENHHTSRHAAFVMRWRRDEERPADARTRLSQSRGPGEESAYESPGR
jgi:ribosomal protein S18 acetylase RimI-like enzyme